MPDRRARTFFFGIVLAAILGAIGVMVLFLHRCYPIRDDFGARNETLLAGGLLFFFTLYGSLSGVVIDASIALSRLGRPKLGGWVCLTGAVFTAVLVWMAELQVTLAFPLTRSGTPFLCQLAGMLLPVAVFAVPFLLYLLLKPKRRQHATGITSTDLTKTRVMPPERRPRRQS